MMNLFVVLDPEFEGGEPVEADFLVLSIVDAENVIDLLELGGDCVRSARVEWPCGGRVLVS